MKQPIQPAKKLAFKSRGIQSTIANKRLCSIFDQSHLATHTLRQGIRIARADLQNKEQHNKPDNHSEPRPLQLGPIERP